MKDAYIIDIYTYWGGLETTSSSTRIDAINYANKKWKDKDKRPASLDIMVTYKGKVIYRNGVTK